MPPVLRVIDTPMTPTLTAKIAKITVRTHLAPSPQATAATSKQIDDARLTIVNATGTPGLLIIISIPANTHPQSRSTNLGSGSSHRSRTRQPNSAEGHYVNRFETEDDVRMPSSIPDFCLIPSRATLRQCPLNRLNLHEVRPMQDAWAACSALWRSRQWIWSEAGLVPVHQ